MSRKKCYNWNFPKSPPFGANVPFGTVLAQNYAILISQDPLWGFFWNYASPRAGHWIFEFWAQPRE